MRGMRASLISGMRACMPEGREAEDGGGAQEGEEERRGSRGEGGNLLAKLKMRTTGLVRTLSQRV
eukprot:767147-Hanusia_phi.AAC.5